LRSARSVPAFFLFRQRGRCLFGAPLLPYFARSAGPSGLVISLRLRALRHLSSLSASGANARWRSSKSCPVHSARRDHLPVWLSFTPQHGLAEILKLGISSASRANLSFKPVCSSLSSSWLKSWMPLAPPATVQACPALLYVAHGLYRYLAVISVPVICSRIGARSSGEAFRNAANSPCASSMERVKRQVHARGVLDEITNLSYL